MICVKKARSSISAGVFRFRLVFENENFLKILFKFTLFAIRLVRINIKKNYKGYKFYSDF